MAIQHFTHPSHLLREMYRDQEYLCNGCNTLGIGMRYRCETCDFNLHEHCGTCPTIFSSFMHPQHQLNLVVRKAQGTRQNNRVCDVCDDQVEGMFYRCKICEFDVHPLCTQLPQYVRHAMHPEHPLMLQLSSPSCCMICKSVCTSWHYRCDICSVDLHLECVLAPCDAPTPRGLPPQPPSPRGLPPQPPSPRSLPPQTPSTRGLRAQPPPPYGAYAYAYYGVPYSSGPYNMHHHPYANQAQGGGGSTNGSTSKVKKIMYTVVGKLALGVLTNVVFGIPGFSYFT